ncbi:hypothetical protein [Corynebacterium diphtheriae]|uniref:hypothetical protein n=1 Tax=Corynebacterium diphtheriae TaxID=1717 RepID=UPI000A6B4187|nr:hypothetical protein [Corynebacterium diphtheriae]
MSTLIDTLAGMKDTRIAEIAQLDRTMNKRRKDTPRLLRPQSIPRARRSYQRPA